MEKITVELKTKFKQEDTSAKGHLEDLDLTVIALSMPRGSFKLNEFVDGLILYDNKKLKFEGQIKELFPAEDDDEFDSVDVRIEKMGATEGLFSYLEKQQKRATNFMNLAKGWEEA